MAILVKQCLVIYTTSCQKNSVLLTDVSKQTLCQGYNFSNEICVKDISFHKTFVSKTRVAI